MATLIAKSMAQKATMPKCWPKVSLTALITPTQTVSNAGLKERAKKYATICAARLAETETRSGQEIEIGIEKEIKI